MDRVDELVQSLALGFQQRARLLVPPARVNVHLVNRWQITWKGVSRAANMITIAVKGLKDGRMFRQTKRERHLETGATHY